ncbi:MAG TPA: PilW family protein [Ramlibacter sp.]|nr:PilW family protein [Ramlibacter sp.]
MNTSMRYFPPRRQAGLTLIEFMVAIVIGMLMIAAMATLIANQSTNRAEIDRAGRLIENGRYAMSAIAVDAQLAGYWGEYNTAPGSGGPMDPCTTTVADIQSDTLEHVQGFDESAADPSCVSNRKANTDILVIRRAEPDSSDVETGGLVDFTKVKQGQLYLQTGLQAGIPSLQYRIAAGAATAANNATAFNLTQKDTTKVAKVRKLNVHIYYVSKCSVEVSGSCTNADGGTPIPTLKRVELTNSGGATSFTTVSMAEGIENMQVDYGVDTNADGMPDSYLGAASITTSAGWASVMTARIYLLTRASETTPGYSDAGRTYSLGSYGTTSAAAGETGYRRHLFTQTVRFVNPAGRLTQ